MRKIRLFSALRCDRCERAGRPLWAFYVMVAGIERQIPGAYCSAKCACELRQSGRKK